MTGRERRLTYEWQKIQQMAARHDDLTVRVTRTTPSHLPTEYEVTYCIRSICGVNEDLTPIFHDQYTMLLHLPEGYPQIDALPVCRFMGNIKPWHPNIRYYGDMAGRVCINMPNTNADLAWCIERIALYLRYELYHAINEPPYPEDLKVAEWVRHHGEPNEWVFYDQPAPSSLSIKSIL